MSMRRLQPAFQSPNDSPDRGRLCDPGLVRRLVRPVLTPPRLIAGPYSVSPSLLRVFGRLVRNLLPRLRPVVAAGAGVEVTPRGGDVLGSDG